MVYSIVDCFNYRKALQLSSEAKSQTTVGQIVNLMSVDAQKIQDAFQFWHLIWSVPLLVGFSMYFLWQTIGVSCLSGMAVLILLVPVNGLVLANRVRRLQVRECKYRRCITRTLILYGEIALIMSHLHRRSTR